jgi:hypothetical protein
LKTALLYLALASSASACQRRGDESRELRFCTRQSQRSGGGGEGGNKYLGEALGGAGLSAEEERDPLAAVVRVGLLLPGLLRGDGRRLDRLGLGRRGAADDEGDAAADEDGEQREEAAVAPLLVGRRGPARQQR